MPPAPRDRRLDVLGFVLLAAGGVGICLAVVSIVRMSPIDQQVGSFRDPVWYAEWVWQTAYARWIVIGNAVAVARSALAIAAGATVLKRHRLWRKLAVTFALLAISEALFACSVTQIRLSPKLALMDGKEDYAPRVDLEKRLALRGCQHAGWLAASAFALVAVRRSRRRPALDDESAPDSSR